MLSSLPTAPTRFRPAGASLLLLVLTTGCSHESFHTEAGSGFRIGLAVTPTLVLLVLSFAGLLGYLRWRWHRNR
jgi:hypothetical protein